MKVRMVRGETRKAESGSAEAKEDDEATEREARSRFSPGGTFSAT